MDSQRHAVNHEVGVNGACVDASRETERTEERYRATFDQAAVGIAHVSTDWRFMDVNQKLCAMLGYTRDELLERGVLDVMHPDDHARSTQLRDNLLSDPGARHIPLVEKRYVRKDGSAVWVAVAVSVMRSVSEHTDRFVVMVQDISGWKNAEERFRATFEQAAVGISHTSLDRRYLMVNKKLCEMTGYSREELLEMRTDDVVHPEDSAMPPEQQMLLEGKLQTFSSEKRYVRKDRSIIWVNRTVSLVRDATGRPLYYLRVIEDVTERNRAQQRAALLQETTLAISEAQDMDAALTLVLEKIRRTTAWSYGQAWLPSADGKTLECRAASHDGSAGHQAFLRDKHTLSLENGRGLVVAAFHSQCSGWVADISKSEFTRRERALAQGFTAWVGIPVVADNRTVALLEFFIEQDRQDDPALLDLVSIVATQLGILFQRKAAEAALRESEGKFRQLTAHIPEIFWMTDAAQELVTYVSPAFEKLTGRSSAEVGNHADSWLTLVHDDDRERVQREWKHRALHGTYDIEFRIIHADGSERWVQDRAFPVRSLGGEIYRIAGITKDITERKRADARLLHLAHYDQLSGLPNRVLFYDRLKQALVQANRNGWITAVLFIDLDRFKAVNDTIGHAGGDLLLKDVSDRLVRCVRAADTLGRLGGDEFAVVLSELRTPQDAAGVASAILEALAEPFDIEGHEIYTAASIGIAVYPSDTENADILIRNADTAMYEAKAAGRNVYRFYTAEMNQLALERMQLEGKLRRALERQEFLLHFQPKLDLITGEIAGCEALLRWASPDEGLVSPARFIPLLEETGLIVQVGEWVLQGACAQLKAWKHARVRPVPIAINLSARQFQQQDLTATVRKALHEHGVAARYLELEITESVAMQNAEASIGTLRELKALGVKLAVDDFGTGYSSLSYLKRLPVDTVKIDRAFVTELATNPDDASIAQAIINMAHNLGLKVVAEGVQTASQLSFLTSHDCDQMQGYYFSRAVPQSEMTDMLRQNRRLQRSSGDADDGERTLLLLDDEENVLSSLKRLLRQDNYRLFTATSARAAFEILASHRVGVIVADQRIPEMTGVEFLRRVKELYPDSVRMVLSGYTDLDSVTRAINQGAIYRFLMKPWEDALLRAPIAEAFRRYASLQDIERGHKATTRKMAELTEANCLLRRTLAELGAIAEASAPAVRLFQENHA
jgi:diguanylate cyclase (GGDEF)-like protein/PAS domain S-box-containing protein